MATFTKPRSTAFIEFDSFVDEFGNSIGSDIIVDVIGDRVNSAMWDTGDSTLGNGEFFTSSTQVDSTGHYYFDVYRANPASDSTQTPQFSVAYGNFNGYGETGLEGQSQGITPTTAIYKQYAALLEDKNDSDGDFKFDISGSTDSVYVINVGRNQLKERFDLELKLSGSSGVIQLVDKKTGTTDANDLGDGPFDVVSGSISSGEDSGATYTSYGKFYPNYGVIILHAANVAASTGITHNTNKLHYDDTSNSYTADTSFNKTNVTNFYNAVKGGEHFKARSTEHLHSRTYFCRIPSYAANHSANPTYVESGSTDGTFRHASFVGNPKTYITTVGLYDNNNELLAVAKLSKPLLKSFNREALVRVRLEY